jgi:hypothetical protein
MCIYIVYTIRASVRSVKPTARGFAIQFNFFDFAGDSKAERIQPADRQAFLWFPSTDGIEAHDARWARLQAPV